MCNLASLNLSAFVDETNRTYDFKRLYEVTKVVTRNLNKVIDVNFYPVIEVRLFKRELNSPTPNTLTLPFLFLFSVHDRRRTRTSATALSALECRDSRTHSPACALPSNAPQPCSSTKVPPHPLPFHSPPFSSLSIILKLMLLLFSRTSKSPHEVYRFPSTCLIFPNPPLLSFSFFPSCLPFSPMISHDP